MKESRIKQEVHIPRETSYISLKNTFVKELTKNKFVDIKKKKKKKKGG